MDTEPNSDPRTERNRDEPGHPVRGHRISQRRLLNRDDVVEVPIDSLEPSDSPRLGGEDDEHARTLVKAGDTLPPIVVHRGTMRVIDGMHRLRACRLRGRDTIEVCFFDGSEHDAFVLAVESNVTNGLPLSVEDRKAAAERIVASHPHYSDRAIGSVAGVSPQTVAAIRGRATEEGERLHSRLGRDGRVRPVHPEEGRRAVGELLERSPHASLRTIAREAGVSPGTVRKVKQRLARGQEPVRRPPAPVPRAADDREEHDGVRLRELVRDPSLRQSEDGRLLLRLLGVLSLDAGRWTRLAAGVPWHHRETVTAAAQRCEAVWREFAAILREQPS
ncbi:ParB/RepB/Spo0J family partition protein [Amycolatopsis sp. CA-230715]|uniref:ParB/RepB/Spo0J family partition protein n=1 Tax=Amycolatopsis sp. CA-230715 TaxID=2745196 RepID=UPI001C335E75|nr:ParB/RepB/Spo0J family partition protein [Amycolatopsis sp. CA-230715]QWF85324.1 Transcriptional regulator NovG [Amycolatopsis sp. CA-230715]